MEKMKNPIKEIGDMNTNEQRLSRKSR